MSFTIYFVLYDWSLYTTYCVRLHYCIALHCAYCSRQTKELWLILQSIDKLYLYLLFCIIFLCVKLPTCRNGRRNGVYLRCLSAVGPSLTFLREKKTREEVRLPQPIESNCSILSKCVLPYSVKFPIHSSLSPTAEFLAWQQSVSKYTELSAVLPTLLLSDIHSTYTQMCAYNLSM